MPVRIPDFPAFLVASVSVGPISGWWDLRISSLGWRWDSWESTYCPDKTWQMSLLVPSVALPCFLPWILVTNMKEKPRESWRYWLYQCSCWTNTSALGLPTTSCVLNPLLGFLILNAECSASWSKYEDTNVISFFLCAVIALWMFLDVQYDL